MSDATPSSLDAARTSRSSVLFSLGQLSQATQDQNRRIDEIPDRVFEKLDPRLKLVEGRLRTHDIRLDSLERGRWITYGGSGAIVTLITLAIGLHHFRILL